MGGGPAHLVVDHGGKNVLVANYGGGSVAVLPIGADGALKPSTAFIQHTGSSVNPDGRKSRTRTRSTSTAADRFAYVADLGLDKVMIYRFDAAKGTLAANDPAFAATTAGRRTASLRRSIRNERLRLRHQRARRTPSPPLRATPSTAG